MKAIDFFPAAARRSPASAQGLASAERALGALPPTLRDFLLVSNGAEGLLSGTGPHVGLWSTDELIELNEAYAVKEFLPDALLVGTDGGGTGFGYGRVGRGGKGYFSVPLIGMEDAERQPLGDDLSAMLGTLATANSG